MTTSNNIFELVRIYIDNNFAKRLTKTFAGFGIDFSTRGVKSTHGSYYKVTTDATEFDRYLTMTGFSFTKLDELFGTMVDELTSFGVMNKAETPKEVPAKPATPSVEEVANVKKFDIQAKQDNLFAGFNIQLPLYDMMKQAVHENVGDVMNDIKGAIKEAAKELQPNVISINGRESVTINGLLHKDYAECLETIVIHGKLFMSGDTGTGKTHMAEQLAKGLNLPYGHLSLTAGISEAHILGRMLSNGQYVPSRWVELYENGGLFLLDEVDAADANTMLVINSAISNGTMSVPNRTDNPIAIRHKDFIVVAAANTWGTGSSEFVREYLDKAFMDRFAMAKIEVTYDEELERKLVQDHPVAKLFQKMRKELNGTQYSVSTRTIVDAYKMVLHGKELETIVKRFTTGLSPEIVNRIKNAGLMG